MLDESGLVAETVAAVGAHAVEVRLVLPVTAVRVLTIFIKPKTDVAFRYRLVFEDAHAALEAQLFGRIRTEQIRRWRRSLTSASKCRHWVTQQQPWIGVNGLRRWRNSDSVRIGKRRHEGQGVQGGSSSGRRFRTQRRWRRSGRRALFRLFLIRRLLRIGGNLFFDGRVTVGELAHRRTQRPRAVFEHVRTQTFHFRESLVANDAMIMFPALEFAKGSSARRFRSVSHGFVRCQCCGSGSGSGGSARVDSGSIGSGRKRAGRR